MSSSGDAPHHHACHDDEEDEGGPPADLSHAGAVVDKAIEYMSGLTYRARLPLPPPCLAARWACCRAAWVADEAIIRVLDNVDCERGGQASCHRIDGGRGVKEGQGALPLDPRQGAVAPWIPSTLNRQLL